MNVRFGLNLLVYTAAFSREQLDLIPKVADMGYDGVEIPVNDLSILAPAATNAARERAGMGLTSCAVLLPGANLISEVESERQAGVAQLKRIVDITAEMGGDTVAGPIYAPVGQLTGRARTEDEWKRGVEGLRAAGDYAGKAGIQLAVEPLNRFETHFLNTAADATRLAQEINLPNVKVQLDTFHGNIEEKDTAAAIRATDDLLGHFHASDGLPSRASPPVFSNSVPQRVSGDPFTIRPMTWPGMASPF
jgi:D-psicose/D-tagatose/L-ribulose 3-epimerase